MPESEIESVHAINFFAAKENFRMAFLRRTEIFNGAIFSLTLWNGLLYVGFDPGGIKAKRVLPIAREDDVCDTHADCFSPNIFRHGDSMKQSI